MHTLRTISLSHLLLAIGTAIGLTPSALAAPITVPNFSFETPDALDGQSLYPVASWTAGGSGFNQFGIWDFNDSSYASSNGDNVRLPGTSHGGQAVSIGIQSLASVGHLTSGGLAFAADNTFYALSIALGNPLNLPLPDTSTIQLLVDGAVVSSTSVAATLIPNGTFTDFSTSFTTAAVADPRIGGTLAIRLLVSSNPSGSIIGDWQTHFDNVRFEATPVPEPSASLVVTVAVVGFGMTRIRWRAQKA
jgi:hypothetical protein